MERITYGAPRLVDWVAQIKAGAATVRVHFTGGALTSYGVTPAEYSTTNPFIQKVIEQSAYFKEGRIVLLRRIAIPDVAMGAKTVEKASSRTMPTAEDVDIKQAAVEAEATGGADATHTTVEASCLQDAQAYLQENYNISSYKVRTYEAAQRAAAEHGVRFVGAKFNSLTGGDSTEEGE